MDPNAALTTAREAVVNINSSDTAGALALAAAKLADSFEALDGWLTASGFLPDAWVPQPIQPDIADAVEVPTELRYWGQGIRFFLASDPDIAEEMTASTLAFCVRHDMAFSPFEGETIEEVGSHSRAELWSDVILPAINDGRIEVTEWGATLTPPFVLPS